MSTLRPKRKKREPTIWPKGALVGVRYVNWGGPSPPPFVTTLVQDRSAKYVFALVHLPQRFWAMPPYGGLDPEVWIAPADIVYFHSQHDADLWCLTQRLEGAHVDELV